MPRKLSPYADVKLTIAELLSKQSMTNHEIDIV